METHELSGQIGLAWMTYRKGQHDAAGKAFEELVNRNSDNIDAHYGLALVRRSQGNRGASAELFKTCAVLVSRALETDPTSDRLEILQTMVNQRLAELDTPAT